MGGGGAGLSFLAKKSWHTSNLSNQEKVWLAEQKAAAESQKVKELQVQIQLEREKEEFERLAGKKSKGDRGVNWMYEEGGGPAYDGENAELEAAKEAEENEAYLLGKEYVPKGQEKTVGDFAEAASMGGVLEKASTRGATIGVGDLMSAGGEAAVHLKDDNEETVPEDDGRSEFNREFHLKHEDPMFAVHKKREMQRKDLEKKRNLMEKAGLVVKEVRKGRDVEASLDDDRKSTKKERSRKRKKHKHRHRDRSSSVSSRSSYSRDRRRRKKKHRRHDSRRHDSRRHEHRGHKSASRSNDDDDSVKSNDERKYDSRRNEKHDKSGNEDNRKRVERKKEKSSNFDNCEDNLDEFGRKRHHDNHSYEYDGYNKRKSDERDSNGRDYYARQNEDGPGKRDGSYDKHIEKDDRPPKKEGYGLIGNTLSGKGQSIASNRDAVKSLGPNDELLAARRREAEQERNAKLEQSRRRRERDGRSKEEIQRALAEMERNAQSRY
eukprot:scaffold8354_cov68-Cyclotella_meneghiniana.AAC.6